MRGVKDRQLQTESSAVLRQHETNRQTDKKGCNRQQDSLYGGRKNYADLTVPNFSELAKTVRMNYLLVTSSSEFREKLDKAFKLSGPVLLEVDVLSVGDMPRYFMPPPFASKEK